MVKLVSPSHIMLVAKTQDDKIIKLTRSLCCHLIDSPPSMPCAESFPHLFIYVDEKLKHHPSFAYNDLIHYMPHYKAHIRFWSVDFCNRVGLTMDNADSESVNSKLDNFVQSKDSLHVDTDGE